MDIIIRKYQSSQDYNKLLDIIITEGKEWAMYTEDPGRPKYQIALANTITYVATADGNICGYSRSINDSGLYIWVIDLLVKREYRGRSIGKQLMECLKPEYPDQDILVMSDVDYYYKKLGYLNEGSIFKVC
ncbi:GNAT family N-acetyltransferase [Owenweeksia hongkongensis]|uniref:GNAT family N-acetyltransferase n=1 Tax=Owenweeksia hongkongensis TaxID=253245 RepID=UPI003A91825F